MSIDELLCQRTGPLTEELLLAPSQFGLGKVPRNRQPDTTTDMVCGYCATGCQLRIHQQSGQPVNLTPSPDYPVNLGMACPKGWEALTVLDSTDRATTPLLRDDAGRLKPVDWDGAMQTFVNRFRDIQSRYGSHSVAFLSTGQIATEEMALLGVLAKFGMGIVARGWQYAPVYGFCGCRLQRGVWIRRAPIYIRRFRSIRRDCVGRQQSVYHPSDHVAAGDAESTSTEHRCHRSEDD